MSFADHFRVKPAPPEPTVQQERADREHALRTQLRSLDAELKILHTRAALFKTQHMSLANGQFVFLAEDVEVLPELRAELFNMQKREGEIRAERSAIMHELCLHQDAREQEERSVKAQLSARVDHA